MTLSAPSEKAPDAADEVVIDVRSEDVFRSAHLPRAAHFCGAADLALRCAELPEAAARRKLRAVVVASNDGEAQAALRILRDADFREVVSLERYEGRATLSGPPVRLWAPSAMALRAEAAARVLALPRTALDVGCGGGRDAAYLASRGWCVTAVDRSAELLRRAAQLATRRYAGDAEERGAVQVVERTFGRDRASDERWLRQHAAALVVVVRFLRRPLLTMLHHAVAPGGLVAYEHFLDGCEEYGAPRKAAQRLRHAELADVFDSTRFEVMVDEVARLDDGRPVSRFIARKVQR